MARQGGRGGRDHRGRRADGGAALPAGDRGWAWGEWDGAMARLPAPHTRPSLADEGASLLARAPSHLPTHSVERGSIPYTSLCCVCCLVGWGGGEGVEEKRGRGANKMNEVLCVCRV